MRKENNQKQEIDVMIYGNDSPRSSQKSGLKVPGFVNDDGRTRRPRVAKTSFVLPVLNNDYQQQNNYREHNNYQEHSEHQEHHKKFRWDKLMAALIVIVLIVFGIMILNDMGYVSININLPFKLAL